MWMHPWKYIEGWSICTGLFITGMVLQLTTGSIEVDMFHYPVNLISGTVFILLLLFLHIYARKVVILQWFSGFEASITASVSLLVLVIIMGLTRQVSSPTDLSSIGGFARTGFMQMTTSWSFFLLFIYFLSILGLVILRRINCFRWKDAGFVLNHVGLFVALFAAILGSGDLQRLRMTASLDTPEWRATNEKNEITELPLAIELKSFRIDEYPPKLMILDNVTGKTLPETQPKSLLVETYPLLSTLLNWEVAITNYLSEAAALITEDTVSFVGFQSEGATSALYVKARNTIDGTIREGWVSCGSFMFPYRSLRLNDKESLIMPNREPKHFASNVIVYTQSKKIKKSLIEVNKPLSIAGWKIYQLNYDESMGKWSRISVFELVKDPWIPAVYSGILMMLAGAVYLFVSAPNPKKN
ncbi:MAG: cytochrome c biogenesis protein ResB [Dysgonamonadaceae bacterium]|jgi:hypothetical protein|nr:cytochrome c biogenesis protein ResB [Dysgonamonadaceae bacterium]